MAKNNIKRKFMEWLGFSENYVSVKEYNKLKKLVNTHHDYLNNIYAFHDLQPNEFLSLMHELCIELMAFFDNVCKKHNLEYWMNYGTLLGAYRHKGLIPWDDDLDVGMMRQDYIKFIEVIQDELEINGVTNIKADFKVDKHDRKSVRWFQLSYYYPKFSGKFIGLDIFPYDYLKGHDGKDIENDYMLFSKDYYHNPDDHDLEDSVYEFYEKFNCTLQRDTHLVPGLEDARNNLRKYSIYKFVVIQTDQVFPVTRIPFGNHEFLAPNDSRGYLIDIYGKKFLQIPKKIRDHDRLNKFRKRENIIEILKESIDHLRKGNEKLLADIEE